MIADALKYLTELANAAVKPFPVETNDPAHKTYLVGDREVNVETGKPKRAHKVASIASMVDLANRFTEQDVAKTDSPVLWVNDESITLVIDDDEHRANVVTMDLPKSAVFAKLEDLDSSDWIDQKSFVRMLRIDLAGTLPPGVLLDRVRKLRFENSVAVSGTVARDRESMGRQIASKVEADGELPETVTLVTLVHEIGAPVEIACAVDVDAARGLLQLLPLPGEIERAKRRATWALIADLREGINESVPIYHGAP